jgi:hypothetical protein
VWNPNTQHLIAFEAQTSRKKSGAVPTKWSIFVVPMNNMNLESMEHLGTSVRFVVLVVIALGVCGFFAWRATAALLRPAPLTKKHGTTRLKASVVSVGPIVQFRLRSMHEGCLMG